jgi:hypothetical protein
MVGLYTADELIASNVTSKEAKLAFLQKAIDVLGMIDLQVWPNDN